MSSFSKCFYAARPDLDYAAGEKENVRSQHVAAELHEAFNEILEQAIDNKISVDDVILWMQQAGQEALKSYKPS